MMVKTFSAALGTPTYQIFIKLSLNDGGYFYSNVEFGRDHFVRKYVRSSVTRLDDFVSSCLATNVLTKVVEIFGGYFDNYHFLRKILIGTFRTTIVKIGLLFKPSGHAGLKMKICFHVSLLR